MKHFPPRFFTFLSFLTFLFFLSSCDEDPIAEQHLETDFAHHVMPLDYDFTLQLDDAIVKGNLMLVPIAGDENFFAFHAHLGDYMPLSEALENKIVTVEESGKRDSNPGQRSRGIGANSSPFISWENNSSGSDSGAAVNMLYATNESETDTVYFMAGEVVDGGKQDRVIAQDLILPPGESADISVFCVEHGRWQYEGSSSTFAWGATAGNSIRKKDNQQDVWDDVKEYNNGVGENSSTGTYMAFKDNDEVKKSLEDQKQVFLAFAEESDIVGIMAISGDAILGCDIFASHQLFRTHFDGLLDSYLSESTYRGEAPVMADADMGAFFQKAKTSFKGRTIPDGSKGLVHANRNIHLAVFE